MNTSATAAATGALVSVPGTLYSVQLLAGVDAATAVLRDGGAGGAIIAALGCAAGRSASQTFAGGVGFSSLYLVVTGTAPVCCAEV